MMAAKGDDAKDRVREEFVGQWIAEPGWSATVEKASKEGSHTFLWMRNPAAATLGGFYRVIADMPANRKTATTGSQVTFTGRVAETQLLTMAPVPELRIAIRNAKTLTVNGK